MDILENSQRGSTKETVKIFGSRKHVIKKAADELCAKIQLRRHNIYKYIKNSFRAGRDQLFPVSWDINSDE